MGAVVRAFYPADEAPFVVTDASTKCNAHSPTYFGPDLRLDACPNGRADLRSNGGADCLVLADRGPPHHLGTTDVYSDAHPNGAPDSLSLRHGHTCHADAYRWADCAAFAHADVFTNGLAGHSDGVAVVDADPST